MIMNYKECVARYGSLWRIKQAIAVGELFKIEPGIYAETDHVPVEAVLAKKYPLAVFSGQYALWLHGLSNQIPARYTLTTGKKTSPIADERVMQLYVPEELLYLGVMEWNKDGIKILVYDKERMLIELLRYKHRMPADLYKEALQNYREILCEIDLTRVRKYVEAFPKGTTILRRLEEEVL